jgi:hypothetical protein
MPVQPVGPRADRHGPDCRRPPADPGRAAGGPRLPLARPNKPIWAQGNKFGENGPVTAAGRKRSNRRSQGPAENCAPGPMAILLGGACRSPRCSGDLSGRHVPALRGGPGAGRRCGARG